MSRIGLTPIKLPRNAFPDRRTATRAIRNVLEARAQVILIDFKVTTQTWTKKPKFYIRRPKRRIRVIGTDDLIYKFVDGGTKSHPITTKNAPMLVFQAGYRAKTRVKVIGSSQGGKFGPTVHKKEVNHPGTEAREFTKEIAKKWQKLLPNIIQRALLQELGIK